MLPSLGHTCDLLTAENYCMHHCRTGAIAMNTSPLLVVCATRSRIQPEAEWWKLNKSRQTNMQTFVSPWPENGNALVHRRTVIRSTKVQRCESSVWQEKRHYMMTREQTARHSMKPQICPYLSVSLSWMQSEQQGHLQRTDRKWLETRIKLENVAFLFKGARDKHSQVVQLHFGKLLHGE